MKGSRLLVAVVACLLLPAIGFAQGEPAGAPVVAGAAPTAPSPAGAEAKQIKPATVRPEAPVAVDAATSPAAVETKQASPTAVRPEAKVAAGAAAAAPAAPAGPAATAAGEAKGSKLADPVLTVIARAFYATLLHRDAEALVALCRPPFYFEAHAANSPEEIKERWAVALQAKNFDAARLYDVELFTPEELTEKYGKPPERLAAWPLRGSMISVGNIDGHPLLVLWKKSGTAWVATGFHD